jgi:hypothetical protein
MEAANAVIVSEVFCGIDARAALPAMQAVVDDWRPELKHGSTQASERF